MKLQLALDMIGIDESISLLEQVGDSVDIVEIGTPLIIREGVRAVREIKEAFPALDVLADVKIMDAGDHESALAFEAGADIVTVLAVAENSTIEAVVKSARKFGRRVMVDMISMSDIETRAAAIDGWGVDYICVHTAFDVQATGGNPLEHLRRLKGVIRNASAAVAGGVKPHTLPEILALEPEVVAVGGAIIGVPDPVRAAVDMKRMMEEFAS